jgi:hypothetical protein
MLHENPLMIDIDVEQWSNLHQRFLRSTKAKERIIVIHENGHILKFVHSNKSKQATKTIARINDPQEDARRIYEDNRETTELVLVLNRKGVERYFAEIQESWSADEDLDEYVYRMYSRLGDYANDIVTYPTSANHTLGLRWTLATTYPEAKTLVEKYVAPNSTALLVILQGNTIWASLLLGFDERRKLKLITTVDRSEIKQDWKEEYREIVKSVENRFWRCSIALFMEKDAMEALLKSRDQMGTLKELAAKGSLVIDPVPETLQQELSWRRLHPIN